jgi:hypothetical protein
MVEHRGNHHEFFLGIRVCLSGAGHPRRSFLNRQSREKIRENFVHACRAVLHLPVGGFKISYQRGVQAAGE